MTNYSLLKKKITEHIAVINSLKAQEDKLNLFSDILLDKVRSGGTIFTCGNGGSASDAQHFTAELLGRYKNTRASIPSVCLNSDTSSITAIANDFGYKKIFTRQIEGLARKNDVVVFFSTSGNSENIIDALEFCISKNIDAICFLGKDGGAACSMQENNLIVKSKETARIQEAHIFLIHNICEKLEGELIET